MHGVEHPDDVPHERAGLPPIGGEQHDRPLLAGGEDGPVVSERGEVDGHCGGNPALAPAAADDPPSLPRLALRRLLTAGVLAIENQLGLRHG
jgi:hypothetical protein